jgi:hypothetical protein
MKGEPNSVTVGGGTPRRMREKKRRLLPYPGNQFVEIVGRRRTLAGLDLHRRMRVGEKAIFRIVDEFGLLPLLHLLGQQAHLFLDLVVRVIIEVGDARLHVEHGRYRIHRIFARRFLVIDKSLRKIGVTIARRAALHVGVRERGRFLDAIEAIDAGLDRNPRQE